MQIYMYQLDITDDQVLELQGEPISIARKQNNDVFLYAWHDGTAQAVPYDIHIAGTGHDVPEEVRLAYKFLGTVVLPLGMLVFHVFYRRRN